MTSAFLYQMWVSPAFRGQGIGMALVDRVKVWAASKGVSDLQLSVTTINTAAVGLYESIGFYPVGNTEPLREGSTLVSQSMKFDLV